MLFKRLTSSFELASLELNPADEFLCPRCGTSGPGVRIELILEMQIEGDQKKTSQKKFDALCCDWASCREIIERRLFAAARTFLGLAV